MLGQQHGQCQGVELDQLQEGVDEGELKQLLALVGLDQFLVAVG